MRITVNPRQLVFSAPLGMTMLEAAVHAGYRMPVSCRNGVCEICEAKLVSGHCRDLRSGDLLRPGNQILVCRVKPESDCTIEMERILAPGELPRQQLNCQIVSVDPINHDVYRVRLRAPAGKRLEYYPGQYLALDVGGEQPSFFSIASFGSNNELELHIQADPQWPSAYQIIRYLQAELTVACELPFGKACMTGKPQRPLLMLAAGTGYAQMKSMLEFLARESFALPVHVYWCARRQQELYDAEQVAAWLSAMPNVNYTPLVSDVDDNEWTGHHDQLVEQVVADHLPLGDMDIYASGSPTMVYTALDGLTAVGAREDCFFSDVFEYAPRPT